MTVTHVNTNDIAGGAARAAYRLHTGLLRIGVGSEMVVVARNSGDPTVSAVTRPMDLASRLRRGVRQYRIAHDFRKYRQSRRDASDPFTDDRTEYGDVLLKHLPPSDVVNLHWVAGFVDYR